MTTKFETFAALHVPGDPVVLYNIWDAGSARAVAAAGAKALATGSHPVGDASGFGDGRYTVEALSRGGELLAVEVRFIGPEQEPILEAFPMLRY